MTAIFIFSIARGEPLATASVSISDRTACTLLPVRILVDYRPALRAANRRGRVHPSAGAGLHGVRPVTRSSLFTSSWKDRPAGTDSLRDLGARVIDRRIPVRVLNYLWHRREWPPVEMLAGAVDVAHSAHPLLMPARRAAQVVTIHDLFFLSTHASPRARRSDATTQRLSPATRDGRTPSSRPRSTARARSCRSSGRGAETHLRLPAGRADVEDARPRAERAPDGCILFVGTLEPRKNVGASARRLCTPPGSDVSRCRALVLAGRATPAAAAWLGATRPSPARRSRDPRRLRCR